MTSSRYGVMGVKMKLGESFPDPLPLSLEGPSYSSEGNMNEEMAQRAPQTVSHDGDSPLGVPSTIDGDARLDSALNLRVDSPTQNSNQLSYSLKKVDSLSDARSLTESLWAQLKVCLRAQFGASIERWFKLIQVSPLWTPADPSSNEKHSLKGFTFKVQTSLAFDWVQKRYFPAIQTLLKSRYGIEGSIELVLSEESASESSQKSHEHSQSARPSTPDLNSTGMIPVGQNPSSLNPTIKGQPSKRPSRMSASRSRLDQFICAPSNQLALSAIRQIVEKGGRVFNPLVLYGGTGVGKSELLHILKAELKAKDPGLKMVSTEAESFLNQFVRSLKEGELSEFRSRFRSLDLLILDDFQILSRKTRTQEELIYTLDRLRSQGCQIVIASNESPRKLKDFSPALISRLVSGLVVPIKKPDLLLRQKLIDRQARKLGLELSREVRQYLAETLRGNVRDLLGAINQLAAYQLTQKQALREFSLEKDQVVEILGDLLQADRRAKTPENICNATTRYFRLEADSLKSKRREKTVSLARRIAVYLCRQWTDHSLNELGRFFGDRNYATIRALEGRVKKDLDKDPGFRETLKDIQELL